jgi:hypothetical protein
MVTMGDLQTIGRWLLIAGMAITIIGGILWLLGRFSGLQNLPGTLKFEVSGLTCIVPLLGSIVISILLTILLNVLFRGGNR